MTLLSNTFGIAARNFTAYPELPDAQALVDYGVRVEELGYDSLWVWDHILLGVDPHFPILDSLTTLTAIAARTSKIKLGTGILVLPLRNPVALAKQLSSMDQFSGGRLIMYGLSEVQTGEKRDIRAVLRGLARMPLATMPWWKSLGIMNENKGVFGLNMLSWWDREGSLDRVTEPLMAGLEKGDLKPIVAEAFPFDRAADAHRFIEERRNVGKVVLAP